jgi:hypothetical protein
MKASAPPHTFLLSQFERDAWRIRSTANTLGKTAMAFDQRGSPLNQRPRPPSAFCLRIDLPALLIAFIRPDFFFLVSLQKVGVFAAVVASTWVALSSAKNCEIGSDCSTALRASVIASESFFVTPSEAPHFSSPFLMTELLPSTTLARSPMPSAAAGVAANANVATATL